MATIQKRKNKNNSITWRVLFRRAGLPSVTSTFNTEKEAKAFAKRESEYIFDHEKFISSLPNPLEQRRKREFKK